MLNTSDRSSHQNNPVIFFYANLLENFVLIRQKRSHCFPKLFTVQNVLMTHNIFFFLAFITYYKSFYAFCIVWGLSFSFEIFFELCWELWELRNMHNNYPQGFWNVWSIISSEELLLHFHNCDYHFMEIRKSIRSYYCILKTQ